MNKRVYTNRKSFSRFDEKHIIAYLNEEVIENYKPEDVSEDFSPLTAYAYTGTEADGGTLLEAESYDRNTLVNALLRTRYSLTEEEAIKTHQILLMQNPDCEKAEEYKNEWDVFLVEREYAISTVDAWLQEQ